MMLLILQTMIFLQILTQQIHIQVIELIITDGRGCYDLYIDNKLILKN